MIAIRHRPAEWLPTVLVLAVVLLAGSRLMYLSVQHHAAVARGRAGLVAGEFARKIELPLQKLAVLAAQPAASARSNEDVAVSSDSPQPQENTFLMTADDKVRNSQSQQAALASGIASEWQSAESARAAPASAVLGPLRLGSQWFVVMRSPLPESQGWSVAFASLDELIADSHLPRLAEMGYDFELSQVEPRSARSRSFVGSSTELLGDAVAARVTLPAAAAIPGSYLQVAIRPHTGWYPASLLASEIGLLAFLAWLLAFGTHDLNHALQRARAALTVARRRLHAINQQLAGEMQLRVTLQETFDHARFHDAFTGLPNRRYFMDQLDRALRDIRTKRRQQIAVIMVDIARFALINETLGHTAGDELMVQIARRFEKSISALESVLARWGGDQFAILMLDAGSTEAALNMAALLQEHFRSPIELRRHRLVVAANFGITSVDSGQQRAEDVVREAEIALTVAKQHESAKIVAYAPSMAGQAANLVSLEADLHVALEKHEFRLLFQPIVDLRTYKMVGAEALLRWRHPVESILGPDKFLRIAEDAGLMVPITRWVILRVVKLVGEWVRRLPANEKFFITINLSPMAVRDPGLSDFVATLLQETQLPPPLLKFELTEAALISNVGAARESLERLRAMGVQLMLDDFGTGYSSLSYLQLFPFDFVKIDRPFANIKNADRANTGMMAAMVQMAGSLNLTPIAEMIETEEAAKALLEMGCNFGQGYFFSEPLEAERALQRLRSREPFQPPPASSETAENPPLQEDSSATSMLPVLKPSSRTALSTSATVRVPVLREDNSPTIMIPEGSLEFPEEDEDD